MWFVLLTVLQFFAPTVLRNEYCTDCIPGVFPGRNKILRLQILLGHLGPHVPKFPPWISDHQIRSIDFSPNVPTHALIPYLSPVLNYVFLPSAILHIFHCNMGRRPNSCTAKSANDNIPGSLELLSRMSQSANFLALILSVTVGMSKY